MPRATITRSEMTFHASCVEITKDKVPVAKVAPVPKVTPRAAPRVRTAPRPSFRSVSYPLAVAHFEPIQRRGWRTILVDTPQVLELENGYSMLPVEVPEITPTSDQVANCKRDLVSLDSPHVLLPPLLTW